MDPIALAIVAAPVAKGIASLLTERSRRPGSRLQRAQYYKRQRSIPDHESEYCSTTRREGFRPLGKSDW